MKKIALYLAIVILLTSTVSASFSKDISWEKDLENGYITTSPIIVDEQVIVRTSGFWSGNDRPNIYSFDLETGEENWRFRSNTSVNHDMSPLLHVSSSSGSCGSWSEMILAGWSDGKITALRISDGSLIWEAQTEVEIWGITGSMAIDGDHLIVPTRSGIGSFCLADGVVKFHTNLDELGWRNGVTVDAERYLLGNENGSLYSITNEGVATKLYDYDGKIRHAPLVTNLGILVHVQVASASEIYLNDSLISTEGSSPAIPLQQGDDIYFGTSSHAIKMSCSNVCEIVSKQNFHTNGEITSITYNGEKAVSFPRNNQDGGWGVSTFESDITILFSEIGTYTTAGIFSTEDGILVFGNDNGILFVHGSESVENIEEESTVLAVVIVSSLAIIVLPQVFKTNKKVGKEITLIFIVLILVFPQFAENWSKEVQKLGPESTDWEEDWPDEWLGTQVLVIEFENEQIEFGGFTGFNTVEELTVYVTSQNNISVVTEEHELGRWITSFNGEYGNGWEFNIDGKRSSLGMTSASIEEDSVVRWMPA